MAFGEPEAEKIVLNIDSLWSGGPFQISVSSSSVVTIKSDSVSCAA